MGHGPVSSQDRPYHPAASARGPREHEPGLGRSEWQGLVCPKRPNVLREPCRSVQDGDGAALTTQPPRQVACLVTTRARPAPTVERLGLHHECEAVGHAHERPRALLGRLRASAVSRRSLDCHSAEDVVDIPGRAHGHGLRVGSRMSRHGAA